MTETEPTPPDPGPSPIKAVMSQRIGELKVELANGQKMLTDLEAKENELKSTLLRISGAIQALEELLALDQTKE